MFRFTIRDVLWLTVVVGLGVGWWVDREHERQFWSDRYHRTLDIACETASAWAEERGGEVEIEIPDLFRWEALPNPSYETAAPKVTIRKYGDNRCSVLRSKTPAIYNAP